MQKPSTDLNNLFQKIKSEISREHLITQTQELVKIQSENPFGGQVIAGRRELEIAEYYQTQLRALGLETDLQEVVPGRLNLKGVLSGAGQGPTLMLAGHLDTVGTEGYKDPLVPKTEKGRIYGRGSCDMKAALSAYLEVVRVLKVSDIKLSGDLIVAGVVDEEDQMIGSKEFGIRNPKADFCIIGEPNSLSICPAHKGQFGLYIRTFGKAVHSSIPHKGVNAIEKMGKVIDAFSDYNSALITGKHHELCGHGTFSPGVIKGGSIVSTVPDLCEMEVDRRILPNETKEEVLAEYHRRLEEIKKTDPDFSYEISAPSWDVSALDTPVDNPLVKAVESAYEMVTGRDSQVGAFTGGTDAPNYGCPAVICGPGALAQAHSLNEYVEIDEIVTATELYLYTALKLLLPS